MYKWLVWFFFLLLLLYFAQDELWMVPCWGTWCDCVSFNDLGHNSHSCLLGDSAMYHTWFWSWRTDYVDNVSRCDFGQHYVSSFRWILLYKLNYSSSSSSRNGIHKTGDMHKWLDSTLHVSENDDGNSDKTHTHKHTHNNKAKFLTELMYLNGKKKGFYQPNHLKFVCTERARERERVCDDGATRIVCSLTSAINFRHENFYSCFPFDLFYLRKLQDGFEGDRKKKEPKRRTKKIITKWMREKSQP